MVKFELELRKSLTSPHAGFEATVYRGTEIVFSSWGRSERDAEDLAEAYVKEWRQNNQGI